MLHYVRSRQLPPSLSGPCRIFAHQIGFAYSAGVTKVWPQKYGVQGTQSSIFDIVSPMNGARKNEVIGLFLMLKI